LKDNFVPKLSISNTEVAFDGLSYGDSMIKTVEFENTGDGLLEFEMSKDKSAIAGNCLTVEPLRGVIKAGEKVQVKVKMQIQ
jgi:hypothetical protein